MASLLFYLIWSEQSDMVVCEKKSEMAVSFSLEYSSEVY